MRGPTLQTLFSFMTLFGLFHHKGDLTRHFTCFRRGLFIYSTIFAVIVLFNGSLSFFTFCGYDVHNSKLDIVFVFKVTAVFWSVEVATSVVLLYVACWRSERLHKLIKLLKQYKKDNGDLSIIKESACISAMIVICMMYILIILVPSVVSVRRDFNNLLLSTSIQFPWIQDETTLKIVGFINMTISLHITAAWSLPLLLCSSICLVVAFQFMSYTKRTQQLVNQGSIEEEEFRKLYHDYQRLSELTSLTDVTFRHMLSVSLVSSLVTACFCVYAIIKLGSANDGVDTTLLIVWAILGACKGVAACVGPAYLSMKVSGT